jgi:chromosome transmission fidelity protein 18
MCTYLQLHQRSTRSVELLNTVVAGVRQTNTGATLLLDTLPYLVHMITPDLRPMNAQLYSARERAQLADVVTAMVHYNLDYRQQRTTADANTQWEYVLEPNIEELISLPTAGDGDTCVARRVLSYTARQMIAREVQMQRVKMHSTTVDCSETSSAIQDVVVKPSTIPSVSINDQLPSTSRKPAAAQPAFWLRAVAMSKETKAAAAASLAGGAHIANSGVWFRYVEGYSNAIRRNVRISDLFK